MQRIFFILITFLQVFAGMAQEQANVLIPENNQVHDFRIQTDTTTFPGNDITALLLGKDYYKKARFLNIQENKEKSLNGFSEVKWRLDSVVTTSWKEESQTIENSVRQFVFSANEGRKMTVKNYSWNRDESHWQIKEGTLYNFNQQNRLELLEHEMYVTLNYRLFTRTYFSYKNGFIAAEWSEEKFDEYDDWEPTVRVEYEYDSLDQLTTVNTQEIDLYTDQWETVSYIEYSHDTLGNVTRETAYDFESYDMVSTKVYELEYAYNAENMLVEWVEYVEGWQEGVFVPERKMEVSYYSEGERESETYYYWDYDSEDWLSQNRKVFNVERQGAQICEIENQSWENQWLGQSKSTFFAKQEIVRNEIENNAFLFSYLPIYEINGLVSDSIDNELMIDGLWQGSGNVRYHFSRVWPVGNQAVLETQIKVFPNPFRNQLNIGLPDLSTCDCYLIDLNGRHLLNKKITGKTNLDVSGLLPGIYILQLRKNSSTVYQTKLIKL